MMIILTKKRAEKISGETSPGHALEPIQIKENKFALPVSVLTDPAHHMHHDFLSQLKQEDINFGQE